MFHNCLCHRGTWGEQFTTLTSHSNLQRMLLLHRLHRSLSAQSLSGPSCHSVSGKVLDYSLCQVNSPQNDSALKNWCRHLFCSFTLLTVFFFKEWVWEWYSDFLSISAWHQASGAGEGGGGCQIDLNGAQLRGGAWRSEGILHCSRPTFFFFFSLQPLRDQSQTPAEQSGCNYNASRATVLFA